MITRVGDFLAERVRYSDDHTNCRFYQGVAVVQMDGLRDGRSDGRRESRTEGRRDRRIGQRDAIEYLDFKKT